MRLHLHGRNLPPGAIGKDPAAGPPGGGTPAVGPQRRAEAVDLRTGSSPSLHWALEADLVERADGALDLRGPWVQGRRGDRFVYLSWGRLHGSDFTLARRAKLMLSAVDPDLLRAADRPGQVLVAELDLTGPDGTPVCAAVRPPQVTWLAADCPR